MTKIEIAKIVVSILLPLGTGFVNDDWSYAVVGVCTYLIGLFQNKPKITKE